MIRFDSAKPEKEHILTHASTRGRFLITSFFAYSLVATAPAFADGHGNVVRGIDARPVGGKTIVTLHGNATPSFTSYRLERPARLVVDLADGRIDSAAGPIDVDTWSVGQIAATQRSDATTRLLRVMIGFKRPSSYDVQSVGNDVVVTITPDEAPPADQLRDELTRAGEAHKSRMAEEAKRKEAQSGRQKAEEELHRIEGQQAEAARRAAEARLEAAKRQKELEAMRDAIGSETAKAEEAVKAARNRVTASQVEADKMEAQRARMLAEKDDAGRQASAARSALTRAEEERAAAAKQVAEARAELVRVENVRKGEQAALVKTREEMAAVTRARDAEEVRLAAARVEAKRVADGAARLAALQQDARREAEHLAAQLEAARRDAQRIAGDRAAEVKRLESTRAATAEVERARAEAKRLEEEAREARAEVEHAKEGLTQLKAQQSAEIEKANRQVASALANVEQLARTRTEEEGRLAAARTKAEEERLRHDAARAATSAADATSATQRLAAARQAESDAKRITDEKTAELTRLEEIRRQKDIEERRLEAARTELRQLAAERAKSLDEQRAAADTKTENARAKAEISRTKAEAEATARKIEAVQADVQRTRAERLAAAPAADLVRLDTARAELERLARSRESELARLDTARAEAERLARSRESELARLDTARAEAERLARTRAIEITRLETARSEAERLASARATELARLDTARAEAERLARTRATELARLDTARAEAEHSAAASSRQSEVARIEAARVESRRVAETRAEETVRLVRVRGELQQLEVARAEAVKAATTQTRELERLERLRGDANRRAADGLRLEAERAETERRLATAKSELARFEKALAEAKLASANPALAVAVAPRVSNDVRLTPRRTLPTQSPLARAYPDGHTAGAPAKGGSSAAAVTDVDFEDGAEVVKVVIAVSGDPDFTVLRTGQTTTLRLKGVVLPARLARTLDTAAFRGPVSSVSTYTDPRDPGAVHVDVKLGQDVEPDVHREGNHIVWEFPKANASQATTRSYPPTRVAGYGLNTMPLDIGGPPANGKQSPMSFSSARHFSGSHIDLDFKDADIHNILRLLADVGQVNIVTSDDTKGTVTIRMRDVPWDQALDVVLKAKGLGMVRDRNLIRVAPQAVLDKELELQTARQQKELDLRPVITQIIPLSYGEALKIMPHVQDILSPRGKVSVDLRTNVLIISDISGNIRLAADLVRSLDTQTPQVLVEARIVEASTSFSREFGIQWGGGGVASEATGNPTGLSFPSTVGIAGAATDALTPTTGTLNGQALNPNYVVNMPAAIGAGSGGGLGMTFGNLAGTFNVNLRLSAAETTGNLRILSAPKVTTLDNVEANIEQGTSIPIQTTSALGTNTVFVDAKLSLIVKPHVTNEGSVMMFLNITRNEPDFSHTGAAGDPTILKRQARTQMLVRDGDTAVIGGIYSRNSSTNYTKVPWLAEIPILGWLFKKKTDFDDRSELLIFITPRILNRSASAIGRQ